MTLTVIMPVYNTGSKLKATLNSILKQDFIDFELLLIDDGSTDVQTVNICKEYSRRDLRVKVVTKENEGIEKTKVFGIQKAKGEYIIFSDHDDLYLPGAFTKLVKAITETETDIVAANYYEQLFRFLPLRTKGYTIKESVIVSHEEFMKNFYINFFGINLFNVSTWAKIYRSELLKNIDFIILGYNTTEDVVLNMQIFPKAHKIAFTEDFLYVHMRGGITSKSNLSLMLKNYEHLFELKQFYIARYDFLEAVPCINYEMMNILKHFIKLSLEANDSQESIIHHLELFKTTQSYSKLKEFWSKSLDNDPFIVQYLAGDYMAIYLDAIKANNKITVRKIAKKILARQ